MHTNLWLDRRGWLGYYGDMRKKDLVVMLLMVIGMMCCRGTLAMGMTGKAKSSDGVEIAYQAEGKGNYTLVFIHGWCCDKSYWKNELSLTEKGYRVVILDLAGHGESGRNRSAYSIKAFGDDVAAVVNNIKADRVILVGHSIGGLVMIEAARVLKEKVIGLIAVDSLIDVERSLVTREENDEFLAFVQNDFRNGVKKMITSSGMFTKKSDPKLVAQIAENISQCSPETGMKSWQAVYEYDLPASMDSLGRSFWNINSDMYPTNIEAGEQHAKRFIVETIPDVGHFIMLENPETFNKVLLSIIASLGSEDEPPVPREITEPIYRESPHHYLPGLEIGWDSKEGKHLVTGVSFGYYHSDVYGFLLTANADLYNLIAKKNYGTCMVGINYFPQFINYPGAWIFMSAGIGLIRYSEDDNDQSLMSNQVAVAVGGGVKLLSLEFRHKVIPYFEAKAIFYNDTFHGRYTFGMAYQFGGRSY